MQMAEYHSFMKLANSKGPGSNAVKLKIVQAFGG